MRRSSPRGLSVVVRCLVITWAAASAACGPASTPRGAAGPEDRRDEPAARALAGAPATTVVSLALRISTADGGAAPPGVRVCVVDEAAREVIARADGGRLTASRSPRSGDVLRVWAPGYDVATRVLAGDGWPSDVVLHPATGAQRVRVVDGATGDSIDAPVTVVRATAGRWTGLTAGGGGAAPEFSAEEVRVPRDGAPIVVPDGLVTTVRAGRPRCFAYPWFLTCRPGGEAVIRVERLRSIALRSSGEPLADPREVDVVFVPDRGSVPSGDALRSASVSALLDTAPPPTAAVRGGVCILDGVPPVAGRIFAMVRGCPIAVTVAATDEAIDLSPRGPARALTVEPRLGGVPLGEGGLVAPGRLDWIGAATIASLGPRRASGALLVRGPAWAPVTLPPEDWITLWHPDRGLAHVRWLPEGDGAEVSLDGDPEPGAIEFRADGDAPFAAWIIAWPVNASAASAGGGGLVSRPGVRALRRECDGVVSFVLRGLPLGTWRCDYGAAAAGRRPSDAVECGVVTLTAAAPRGRIVMRRRE